MRIDPKVLADLIECIDVKACDGFTIWITPQGQVQANLRDKVTDGWTCCTEDTVDGAIAAATKAYLNGNRNNRPRVVTVTKKKRREISDLA